MKYKSIKFQNVSLALGSTLAMLGFVWLLMDPVTTTTSTRPTSKAIDYNLEVKPSTGGTQAAPKNIQGANNSLQTPPTGGVAQPSNSLSQILQPNSGRSSFDEESKTEIN